ncbi:MAG: hypothetical protein AUK54_07520 [Helicobacteraceae bacterium CG2_30_36_10]|nr:MAG: hypothetical protein AUK54_07520 [Helicobacteraceae bacterium CG2_30_36_10]
MITLFNIWHFVVFAFIGILFIIGVVATLKQPDKKLQLSLLISISLVAALVLGFSIIAVDKYTKVVNVYQVENKRLLSIEKIIYTGIVKNEGNYEIGKVTLEVKLVNKGHVTGNVKAGSFFKASGFFDFFFGESDRSASYRPQTIVKEFVVAQNLKPGEAKAFRVYFDYPPYFRSVANFTKVTGH